MTDSVLVRLAAFCPPASSVFVVSYAGRGRSAKIRLFVSHMGAVEEITRTVLSRLPQGATGLKGLKSTGYDVYVRISRDWARADAQIAADVVSDLLGYEGADRLYGVSL